MQKSLQTYYACHKVIGGIFPTYMGEPSLTTSFDREVYGMQQNKIKGMETNLYTLSHRVYKFDHGYYELITIKVSLFVGLFGIKMSQIL